MDAGALARLAALEARVTELETTASGLLCQRGRRAPLDAGQEDAILLSIGGKAFTTTLSTLRLAGTGSFLYCLAEAAEAPAATHVPFKKNSKGAVRIDRSPKHFSKILDFLRNGDAFVPPRGSQECDEVLLEARFYGLPGLAAAVDRLRVVHFAEECAVRTRETSFTLAAPGLFWASLTVPNPEAFSVVLHLEGERTRRGIKRNRGENDYDFRRREDRYQELHSPWSSVDEWTMAIRPGGAPSPPPSKRVWLAQPRLDWTPRQDARLNWYLVRGEDRPSNDPTVFGRRIDEDDRWQFQLLARRPQSLEMPPLPSTPWPSHLDEQVCFDADYLLQERRSAQDRLEVWPEPAFATARVLDLGPASLQISERLTHGVNAGARITFADGSTKHFWIYFSAPTFPGPACLWTIQDGETMQLHVKRKSIRSSLGVRSAAGARRIMASCDGVDVLDLPGMPGHELLFLLSWEGDSVAHLAFK